MSIMLEFNISYFKLLKLHEVEKTEQKINEDWKTR